MFRPVLDWHLADHKPQPLPAAPAASRGEISSLEESEIVEINLQDFEESDENVMSSS